MEAEFLTIRLSKEDAHLIRRLRETTGLTRTEIVKQALRSLGGISGETPGAGGGLFELGAGRFGQHGNVRRQSSDMKRIVRSQVRAKRSRR